MVCIGSLVFRTLIFGGNIYIGEARNEGGENRFFPWTTLLKKTLVII